MNIRKSNDLKILGIIWNKNIHFQQISFGERRILQSGVGWGWVRYNQVCAQKLFKIQTFWVYGTQLEVNSVTWVGWVLRYEVLNMIGGWGWESTSGTTGSVCQQQLTLQYCDFTG